MTTIPASDLVNVSPSVENAGGTAVATVGICLTSNPRVPIGQVLSFPNGPAVTSYFGGGSTESVIANGAAGQGSGYFGGYNGATAQPANILFAQYNPSAAAAFIRGGSVASLTIAQLQAISGSLNITVDGYPRQAATVNLSSASSFSAAATAIATALNLTGSNPNVASVTGSVAASTNGFTGSIAGNLLYVTAITSGTIVSGTTISGTGVTASTQITGQISGTPGGIGVYAVNIAQIVASTAISGTYGTLTVTAVASGTLAVGQTVAGGTIAANSQITQLGTGVGLTGTYFINTNTAATSTTVTAAGTPVIVTYDSVSGGFVITSGVLGAASTIAFATGTISANLNLTSATGAVLSQGAAPATPATAMASIIQQNSNWVSFFTAFDPDGGSGNLVKQQFAAWKNSQNNRFAYICCDNDASPTTQVPATASLGYILTNNSDSGTCLISEPALSWDALNHQAFVAGSIAAINFNKKGGRISLAYRSQPGLVAAITSDPSATNLAGNPQTSGRGNGYNFYGAYSNANQNFINFQRGFVTGGFSWLDTYINQIWMNSLFQSALLNLEMNSNSIPYATNGYGAIEAALATPIQQALIFGAFGPATLSSSQIAQVNSQAGTNISDTLQALGYYLQIVPAPASIRAARTSPSMTFWYIDQGSVQSINLNSVALL